MKTRNNHQQAPIKLISQGQTAYLVNNVLSYTRPNKYNTRSSIPISASPVTSISKPQKKRGGRVAYLARMGKHLSATKQITQSHKV
jgi:hypothetical protein